MTLRFSPASGAGVLSLLVAPAAGVNVTLSSYLRGPAGPAGPAGGRVHTYRTVTAAGDVTVATTDDTILINKTIGAATSVNLPLSSSVDGSITIKDYKGDANTNNITIVPAASETIDGFSPAAAITNGSALIDINYGYKVLYPLLSGGWYLLQ